jgi:hypothetical protein
MDGPANTFRKATTQSERATRFRSPVSLDHRDGMRRSSPPLDARIQCNYRPGVDDDDKEAAKCKVLAGQIGTGNRNTYKFSSPLESIETFSEFRAILSPSDL